MNGCLEWLRTVRRRVREIDARSREIVAEQARKHPGENAVQWAWIASGEWNELSHERGILTAQRFGFLCAVQRERRFWNAFMRA